MTPTAARGIWAQEGGPDGDAAPLVVLVHGSMDRSAGMLKVARLLDETCRVARYDRRGYGRSAPHAGPFTMDEQLGDLLAVVAERPAVLVGHSFGGDVALALADRRPELVRGVAVYETPLSWEPWWPGTTAGSRAVADADRTADTELAAERFMRRMVGDERWEALPARTREARRREGAAMVGELTDLRRHRPWRAERIAAPVLAGVGSEAAAHHRRAMEEVAATVPGAHLVVLAGARHDAPLSHPQLFTDLLVRPLLGAAAGSAR